jgi:hypothetical protein
VFWSQALRLRSPLEDLLDSDSNWLRDILHFLEEGSNNAQPTSTKTPAWDNPLMVTRRRKGEEAGELISTIRQKPGFERFLLGQPLPILAQAASCGAVIVLMAHHDKCEVVVLLDSSGETRHIILPGITVEQLTRVGDQIKISNLRSQAELYGVCLADVELDAEVSVSAYAVMDTISTICILIGIYFVV